MKQRSEKTQFNIRIPVALLDQLSTLRQELGVHRKETAIVAEIVATFLPAWAKAERAKRKAILKESDRVTSVA